jgi:dTDP-4-dehydrorhamnose 3,5-epimerase
MEIVDLALPGVKKIRLRDFADSRGFFQELYRKPLYANNGILCDFVQDNHSFSEEGTLRGMHYQSEPGQAKLVTPLVGTIYDVFVDIRPASPTFGKWGAATLSSEKHEQIFIPVGYAHGFAVLSEFAHVCYKVSTVYNPATECSFRFDDPAVGIDWPIELPILSEKDASAPTFAELLL